MLVQEPDRHELSESELKTVTERKPTDAELRALLFAWKVSKHVKSNAIVFAREGQTCGNRRRANEPGGFGEDCGDESGKPQGFLWGAPWWVPMRFSLFPTASKKRETREPRP